MIYTFLQLLITYLGGERSLLIILHGRPPIPHPFPVNIFLHPMDVSDPWVLLNLKRGVLRKSYRSSIAASQAIDHPSCLDYQTKQLAYTCNFSEYVQVKPLLVLVVIALKATGTYHEGRFATDSGYTYVSIAYNASICLSL